MQYLSPHHNNSQDFSSLPLFEAQKVLPLKYNEVLKPLSTALQAVVMKSEPEDKEILEARKILGDLAKDLSSEEVRDILTEVQFLVDSWLDDFEKQIFEGKTLKELLHEKGRL